MYILSQNGEDKIDMRNIHSMDVGIGPVIRLFSSDDKSGIYTGIARYNNYDIADLVLSDLENRLTDDPYYIYQMPQGNEQWIADAMSNRNNGWIRVKDRNPGRNASSFLGYNSMYGEYVVVYYDDNLNVWFDTVNEYEHEITHWRSLPESPMED